MVVPSPANHRNREAAHARMTSVHIGPSIPGAAHHTDSPRLLWIDDEIQVTDACVCLLLLEGYRVECAASGAEALHKIDNALYDGIILDLRLQNESGLDVLDALRARGLTTRVLVLTGWTDWASAVAAMKRGAWDYQSKTTMLTDEWLGIVKTMVALSRIPSERQPPATNSPREQDIALITQLEGFAAQSITTSTEATAQGEREAIVGLLLSALTDARLMLSVFLAIAESVRRMLAGPPTGRVADRCANACGVIRRAREQEVACRHPKVKEALAQLEAHPRRWAEEELARTIGVSPSHFGRVVHHDTGLSYRDLRRAATLKPAIREILLTDEQVAQIALRVGFQHPTQFAREVHETFGMSPRQLRRLWKRLAVRSDR